MKTLEELKDSLKYYDITINILNNKVVLVRNCNCYEYNSEISDYEFDSDCCYCHGTGVYITEEGEAIIDLMEAHKILEQNKKE
jgi:hypothetical protein